MEFIVEGLRRARFELHAVGRLFLRESRIAVLDHFTDLLRFRSARFMILLPSRITHLQSEITFPEPVCASIYYGTQTIT
ncbi:hypothetical protein [Burkholderia sp. F1]|uniref:hypothetical protein n=1 Tax=Burkholderia sp. F1 TaxID=3366817 RepID=UPI003D717B71